MELGIAIKIEGGAKVDFMNIVYYGLHFATRLCE